jgi:integrase
VRDTIIDFHKELTNEDLPVTTMTAHCESWLARKKPEIAISSYAAYSALIKGFLAFLGERAEQDINNITRNDVTGFRNDLAGKIAPVTVNNRIKSLRSVFKDAERGGYLQENPAAYVDRLKVDTDKKEKKPFTVDELKLVLAKANSEWKSMILFGLYTGQRLGDIIKLDWGKIDLNERVITIVTGKTGTRLRIPIAGPLYNHILTLKTSDDPNALIHPLAYKRFVDASMKVGTLSNQFTKLLEDAGLREKTTHESKKKGRGAARDTNQLSFHSLRHTAVTMMHMAGIPAATVQALIGHDSDAVHQLYTHVDQEALKKAAKALPDLSS